MATQLNNVSIRLSAAGIAFAKGGPLSISHLGLAFAGETAQQVSLANAKSLLATTDAKGNALFETDTPESAAVLPTTVLTPHPPAPYIAPAGKVPETVKEIAAEPAAIAQPAAKAPTPITAVPQPAKAAEPAPVKA